jgi:hypothetical protein
VVAATLVSGCTGETAPGPARPTQTPLAEIDLSGLTVGRGPFCEALDEGSVEGVLDGAPAATDHYVSGERRRLAPGVRDVVDEFGCTFQGAETATQAWVFAPPATRPDVRSWLAERASVRGCSPTGDVAFGSPGQVLSCDGRGSRTVTMAGLFGDAFLTCEVTTTARSDAATALESAQRWCASVARAASTS